MYKFKVKANGDFLEKYGYKVGETVRVYDKKYFQNRYGRMFKCFKIYDITKKEMIWVDAYCTEDF